MSQHLEIQHKGALEAGIEKNGLRIFVLSHVLGMPYTLGYPRFDSAHPRQKVTVEVSS